MYDPTKEGLDIASRFGPASTSPSSRGAYSVNQQSTGQPSYAQGIPEARTYTSYTSSNIVQPDVSLPSIKDFAGAIGRQVGANSVPTYGMNLNDGTTLVGPDRNLTWSRSRGQEMSASQQPTSQPYYSTGYSGFEPAGGNMMQGHGSRPQNLPPSQTYYGNMAQGPDTAGPTYYQAHSYSQPQQLPPPPQSNKPMYSDYPHTSNQMGSGTAAAQYYQQPQAYPPQAYSAEDYYPQNGQSSSASTLPSARSGGNYQSNSPPVAPGTGNQPSKPGLQQTTSDRIIRTDSNDAHDSPESRVVAKKESRDTPVSSRKGKGKVVTGSDYGDDDDAQEGTGKEGKTSTADFIRRLWTMMQAFSKEGALGEGGKFLDWAGSGESFIIKDKHHFEKNILVQHFRHCNFSSFVRQLNKYGFKKVKRGKAGKGKDPDGPQPGEEWWEFRHPDFRQDGQIVLEMIKRKAANPRKVRANGDAALRQEAAQHAAEPMPAVASTSTHRLNQSSSQNMNTFGDNIVQQQVQSLMQLNSNLSSRVMDLETQVVGLREQMKVKDEADRKKEEWFPSFVAFMIRNLSNLTALDGAEQLLTEMNSLQASFSKENPALLNLGELLPPTSLSSLETAIDDSKQVPMYTYMSQPTTTSSAPIWAADGLSNTNRPTSMMGTEAVPVATLNDRTPLSISVPTDDNLEDQSVGISSTSYQDTSAMMEMVPVDLPEGQEQQIDTGAAKEIAHHKRNTMSNWASSLSWTKAPRVLVVEDDAVSRNLAIRFLQLIGCEVDQVTDAESAIAKINSAPFDVVFMDIILPKMTGHDATKILRASNVTLPIIPMTSSFGDDDRKRYDAHGMTDLLPKPFSRDQLYSMLERHLSHLKAAKRYAINIPPAVGVPPLSDQGVNDALRYSAAHYDEILKSYNNPEDAPLWNPLGGSGTSDAEFIQMVGLQQSMNPDGGPIDLTQMMQNATGTALEFTMVPSDAFAAEMGLQMASTRSKRDRDNDQEDEASKRARTGPTVTALN